MSSFGLEDLPGLFNMTENMHANAGVGSMGGAYVEEGGVDVRPIGRPRRVGGKRVLFPGIDVAGALVKPVGFGASSNSMMTPEEAGEKMRGILARVGLETELDNVKLAFVRAMLLCYAMNSSSVLNPDRGGFWVTSGGHKHEFNFHRDVMEILGNDARRFFRAYADEVRVVLESLRDRVQRGPVSDDEEDGSLYEQDVSSWDTILIVAKERGMSRMPTLVHDSAEFCTGLTAEQSSFVTASKKSIFRSIGYDNPADRVVLGRADLSSGGRGGSISGDIDY